jgi:phosphoribosyl-ATP pyrophosphohydrolase/phosphoribosyl-AMP cyclohydrolase
MKIENLEFDDHGLIPAIVQDARTREVLTLAYMNAASLRRTIETGETWFWSRSRNALWHKGETSGNTQRVVEIKLDCDADAVIVLVEPSGPACHIGARSCFFNEIDGATRLRDSSLGEQRADNLGDVLDQLFVLIETRKRERLEGSYTSYLFNEGLDKILKKVGEESAETIIAAKNEGTNELIAESSDLLYHLLVLLVERGVQLDRISDELRRRRRDGLNRR